MMTADSTGLRDRAEKARMAVIDCLIDYPIARDKETERFVSAVQQLVFIVEDLLASPAAGAEGWVLVPKEPRPEMLKPFATEWCKQNGIDPEEPQPPHGEYPRWYEACAPFVALYAAMLAASPAPSPATPPAEARDLVERALGAIAHIEMTLHNARRMFRDSTQWDEGQEYDHNGKSYNEQLEGAFVAAKEAVKAIYASPASAKTAEDR